MKLQYKLFCVAALFSAALLSSCIGDLDVTPIDPNMDTADQVLKTEDDYLNLLAKCYSGLAVSSTSGPNEDPDISGIDGGFGQYFRGLYNLTELPTDEAVMSWNDQTIKDLHGLRWSSSDVFVGAMYSRLFYQITMCNEFIRRARSSSFNSKRMNTWIAEARCLRALSYYHAIDLFGNVPFVTQDNAVGCDSPQRISRADLYNWLVNDEIPALMEDLTPARQSEKYHVDQGLAKIILAKLHLNAEVYANVNAYDKCVEVCKELVADGYILEDNFPSLFGADNDRFIGSEIIFSVYQDGVNCQSYGGSTFMILATTHNDWCSRVGTKEGWGGVRVTPEFFDNFTEKDERARFYTEGHKKDIEDVGDFKQGYAYIKYTNLTEADNPGQHGVFSDCDIVVFRMADVYLMLSECAKRGASNITEAEGLQYLNMVRSRAKVSEFNNYTINDVLNERSRELAWECHRRSDLIRFDKLTSGSKLWSWKGNVKDGKAVDSKYNLYPIPSNELNNNPNLVQNPGY